MRWLRRRWARKVRARFHDHPGADLTNADGRRRVYYDATLLGEFAKWLDEECER